MFGVRAQLQMSGRVERGHHDLQESRQRASLASSETPEEGILLDYQVLQRCLHTRTTCSRHAHSHGASILGINLATDEPPPLQMMEAVRHRS